MLAGKIYLKTRRYSLKIRSGQYDTGRDDDIPFPGITMILSVANTLGLFT